MQASPGEAYDDDAADHGHDDHRAPPNSAAVMYRNVSLAVIASNVRFAARSPGLAYTGLRWGEATALRVCDLGALGGTRTPNLLIRSKIRFVQIRPPSSIRPAGTLRGDLAVPALSVLVQIRC
jgi:integrase